MMNEPGQSSPGIRPGLMGRHFHAPYAQSINGEPVYARAVHRWGLWGLLIGGCTGGVVAFLVAAGITPVGGLGQMSSGGPAPASFTGFVLLGAVGWATGSLAAILRLPRRHVPLHEAGADSE